MSKLILARNTVSGVVAEIPESQLAHPVFGKVYVRVEKAKDEVLAQPYQVIDGERKPLPKPAKTEKESS